MLGKGKRLFESRALPVGLEVTDARVLRSGVIVADYRSGVEIKRGSFALETR